MNMPLIKCLPEIEFLAICQKLYFRQALDKWQKAKRPFSSVLFFKAHDLLETKLVAAPYAPLTAAPYFASPYARYAAPYVAAPYAAYSQYVY